MSAEVLKTMYRHQGDTYPYVFTSYEPEKLNGQNVVQDVVGHTFSMFISEEEDPSQVEQVTIISGDVQSGADGKVNFLITPLTPGTYYYEVMSIDDDSYVRTHGRGKLIVKKTLRLDD